MALERLQKILASAGVASRRKAEEMITAGQVSVNGETVTELGTKADLDSDQIKVDGKLLQGAERPVYIMLYKPKGHVTTVTDPEGRPTVLDLVKGIPQRVFPVGRLDYLSEGLLLLTNDGDLMQKLTHASSHVPKTYMVKIAGVPAEEELDKLRAGILLPPEPSRAGTFGGTLPGMKRRSETVKTQPCEIELVKEQENPWYKVTLVEGRNRQIRRMFEQIRHHVEKIKRVRYGSLELDIEPGQFRFLTPAEVGKLRVSANKPYKIAPPRPRPVKRERVMRDEPLTTARDRAASSGRDSMPAPKRASGLSDRQRRAENRNTREGGFTPREDRTPRREGGFKPREQRGGSAAYGERKRFTPRDGAPKQGFKPREGGFKPREERGSDRPRTGGFGAKREGFKPREGGFKPREDRGARPEERRSRTGDFTAKREGFKPREGGFKPRGDRPSSPARERSGTSGGYDRPKRAGFGAKREGFVPRERSTGFVPKREGAPAAREGGYKPRTGGFKPREDRGARPPRPGSGRTDSERPRSGGFSRPKRADSGPKREGFAPRERSSGDFKKRSNPRGPGRSSNPSRPPSGRGMGRPPKKDR